MFGNQITTAYDPARALWLAGWIWICGLVWGLTGCEDVSSPAISSTSSPTEPTLFAANVEAGGLPWQWLWEDEAHIIRHHLAAAERLVYQDKAQALIEAQKAHRLSVRGEYRYWEAESRYWMALAKKQSATEGEGIAYPLADAEMSLSLFQELPDALGTARSQNLIGILHYLAKDLSKAARYQQLALETLRLVSETPGAVLALQGEIHQDLGNIYYDQGTFAQATEQYDLSQLCYQQLGLDERLHRLLIDRGHVAKVQNRIPEAQALYEAALAFGREDHHQEVLIKAHEALGMLYLSRFRDTQSLSLAQASHQAFHAMLDQLTESRFRAYYQLARLFHLQASYPPAQSVEQNVDSAWHYYLLAMGDAARAGETNTMAKVVNNVQGLYADPASPCHVDFVKEFPDVQQEHYEAANRQLVKVQREADYSIHLAHDLNAELLRVPSMVIQPFVENAIFHGIRPKEEPGQVSIRIQRDKQDLLIVVDDDGIGRAAAAQIKAASAMHATPSYGIRITQERLEKWSTKRLGVRTIDKVDQLGRPLGTRVEIRLPNFQRKTL